MQPRHLFPHAIPAVAACLILFACAASNSPVESAAAVPAPSGVWVDPETHLTWAAKDNGYPLPDPTTYCENLTTGGFQDWVVPSIDQLETLYWVGENDGPLVRGYIKLTADYEWGYTKKGSLETFFFRNGRNSNELEGRDFRRVLCVRRAGN